MTDTPVDQIAGLIAGLRTDYSTGFTRPLEWRKAQLKGLLRFVTENKTEIYEVIKKDLGRHEQECEMGENAMAESSIKDMISHLSSWAAPRSVATPLMQIKGLSTSQIIPEPKGVVLVISPWNYPIQLPILGIATAIAAGNCTVLKPSEVSEHSTKLIADKLFNYLDGRCCKLVLGGVPQATEVLRHKFDHILYTGNGAVGRIVMRAAAEHLTPVTLELGGKSPVIVDKDVDLEVTARRIIWGRFFNNGQSCVSCDYVLVHSDIKDKLVVALKDTIKTFYGEDPKTSPSYGHIINRRQWQRLDALIKAAKEEDPNSIILGGQVDEQGLYIAPTLLLSKGDSAVMRDEVSDTRDKPLALYIFTKNSSVSTQVIENTSSGGVVVNDSMVHYAVQTLPFGGVGESGIGAYHGQVGFDTFSHLKPVLNKTTWFDVNLRYPPYSEEKMRAFDRVNI